MPQPTLDSLPQGSFDSLPCAAGRRLIPLPPGFLDAHDDTFPGHVAQASRPSRSFPRTSDNVVTYT